MEIASTSILENTLNGRYRSENGKESGLSRIHGQSLLVGPPRGFATWGLGYDEDRSFEALSSNENKNISAMGAFRKQNL